MTQFAWCEPEQPNVVKCQDNARSAPVFDRCEGLPTRSILAYS